MDATLQKKKSSMGTLLDGLTTYEEKPNPRLSCSPGIVNARQLIESKLEEIDVKPMGDDGFRYTVPGTIDSEECPDGITNLIGVIEGSDPFLKDEYIMLSAHIDGPENEGPSSAQGLLDTDNTYDDGSGTAALLSMAEYFVKAPPRRSLILFFSDGEEGIHNVAVSEGWKQAFCVSPAYWGPPGCHNYPIGMTAWVKDSKKSFNEKRLVIAMDPLGAPGIKHHDFVAVLGTETTPGLQKLVEGAFAGAATKPLYVNRMYVGTSYSDGDAFTKDFTPLCLQEDGGIGVTIPKELATFALDMRRLAGEECKNFDDDALLKVTESLKSVVTSLADNDALSRGTGGYGDLGNVFWSSLVYNPKVYSDIYAANHACGSLRMPVCGFSLQDAVNNKNAYDFLKYALSNTPAIDTQVASTMKAFCGTMSDSIQKILEVYKDVNEDQYSMIVPKGFNSTLPAVLAVSTMALDFYADEPYRQPFYQ
ncbi:unnamed protein product [Durusdinium trenchii]|uniref:Peptidase M28 domain-containing protein n=1 Tax=Durusdinium trenchii TaxID=1381693 RepID=A0ABP0S7H5_9DINO